MTRPRVPATLVLLAMLLPATAGAQGLARRIAASGTATLQFSFAARTGVCGDGRHYFSTAPGNFNGTIDQHRAEPCVAGPVRVVVTRADGATIALNTYVGPLAVEPGATDLGTVGTTEAVEYLLALAAEVDGRPGRDAILPAAIADSVTVGPRLLALGRDRNRTRETRRSALSWAGRLSRDDAGAARIATQIGDVARDAADDRSVRGHSVSVLARIERGGGVPELLTLVRGDDPWLADQAMTALSRSGDPRARPVLREIAGRGDAPEALRVSAIAGLGRAYATPDDAAFLRQQFGRLQGSKERDAVIAALTGLGGAANVRWLLDVARNGEVPIALRRKAVTGASRAGATSAELVPLYDVLEDRQMRETLVDLYVRSGDRASIERLLTIARDETDRNLRRRTISRLSRLDDPRVREALREMVER